MSTNPVGAFIVFTFPKHFETFLPSIVKFENFKLKLKFYFDYNWFFYPHIYINKCAIPPENTRMFLKQN